MIGDTPYDAEAALGAGTSAGGLLTGGFAREALEGAGFFVVAREVQDLLPCLESRSRHLAVVRGFVFDRSGLFERQPGNK